MFLQEKRKWREPLDLASLIPKNEKQWALLYSGLRLDFTGKTSILAIRPKHQVKSQDFLGFSKKLSSDKSKYSNLWLGYLGYDLKNNLEKLPKEKPSFIQMPHLWMVKYKTILVFNHQDKNIEIWSEDKFDFAKFFSDSKPKKINTKVKRLSSNMSAKQYLNKVATIKGMIDNGDLYQANLTRKFFGEFSNNPSALDIFASLSKNSPSPYSCLMKLDNHSIISSSPELFLKVDAKGKVETRPIKGSAKRGKTKLEDAKQKKQLSSEKERAENLMIVDLMRNDLAKSCQPGSISVNSMFDITSYSTIHQLSSTISGKKKKDVSTLSLVTNCFPPGSMTGTPKVKAMETCAVLEQNARGVYSGGIGWFGGDGSAELSVVIRTLIIKNKKFEFQVGGAIVSDSVAKAEFSETIDKAAAIMRTLDIAKSKIIKI